MDEEYFTIPEVADRLKVSRQAVYKWMRDGKLPYVIVGGDRRITGSAIKAFVRPGPSPEQHNEPTALLRRMLVHA